jgi:hypothetical protein
MFFLRQRLASVGLALLFFAVSSAKAAVWLDVPFVRQEKNLCAAASVSMILQYWEQSRRAISSDVTSSVPPFSEIAIALRSPERKGVHGSRIRSYLASLGYQVFTFKGEWADIEMHISKGRPLIVGLGNSRALDHYVVVVGWDSDENVVLVNDPARRKLLKVDRAQFRMLWEQTSFWTLLALPAHTSVPAPTPR